MNNKKLFLRVNTVVLSTFCLFLAGCNKSEPESASKAESSKTEEQSQVISSSNNPSSVIPPEETYHIVRPSFTPDYDNYGIGAEPSGFNMTYYSDAYSRGFSWLTDLTAEQTELYIVQSDKGEQADFSAADYIEGTSLEIEIKKDGTFTAKDGSIPSKKGSGSNEVDLNLYSHKVHVENLEKGKAYSYKVGSEAGYIYGAFIVEKDHAKDITAVHMSDAQTKDISKTNIWRNTFVKGVETAGEGLDMALYNGDQFDQNSSTNSAGKPARFLRHTKAIDVIWDYKFDIPYMASSGNHEPSVAYANYLTGDINYAAFDEAGCYYSYDVDYAHFVVLNTNTIDDAQINWLKEDLEEARNAKWKVVMMHISPYSTGDHCQSKSSTPHDSIVEKFTPIFSEYHVDLVLQAHDHTYNKTLPYRWDAAGYTTNAHDNEVVNMSPSKKTVDGVEFDDNPEGTYYVTTGAAGHRYGAGEEDGIWAECVLENGEIKGLNPSKTFTDISKTKYAIEVGELTQENQYEPYTHGGYTSDQHYEIGDPASGNVNAPMFGVLNLTEETMSYHVYTALGDDVKLFDTLDVYKN